jgi:hypothetical protein
VLVHLIDRDDPGHDSPAELAPVACLRLAPLFERDLAQVPVELGLPPVSRGQPPGGAPQQTDQAKLELLGQVLWRTPVE